MDNLHYALERSCYTWENALFWGNFAKHCEKASKGTLGDRIVHTLIAAVEVLPIVGQIASICEKIIASSLYESQKPLSRTISLPSSHVEAEVNEPLQVSVDSLNSLKPLTEEDVATFKDNFSTVHSSLYCEAKGKKHRADFLSDATWPKEPVVLSKSEFVPSTIVEHLMRDKKDTAIGVKYTRGSSITNMEGAMHTFVTPICPVTMVGDYKYTNRHTSTPLPQDHGRKIILSAAIHPDFECGHTQAGDQEVVMKLVELQNEEIVGSELPQNFQPLVVKHKEVKAFEESLPEYERSLQEHMIYHLTKDHKLPARSEVQPLNYKQAIKELEQMLSDMEADDIQERLQNKCVTLNGHIISLEALFTIYVHQIRNEFSVLEATLPQGYVYTIDPPSIFAAELGRENVPLLNRLQLLALKHLSKHTPFNNLKVIGVNNYADKTLPDLYAQVFKEVSVLPKTELFKGENGLYSPLGDYALVLHNNSDAFGQNIETEGPTSMDGVIGSQSDAACHLKRDRPDLLAYVV